MSRKAGGFCLVTMVLAGGFALAAIGKSAAEVATNKCALEWKAAKANGTTGGKSWKEFFDQCGTDQNGLSRSITLTPADPKPAAADATPAAAPPPLPRRRRACCAGSEGRAAGQGDRDSPAVRDRGRGEGEMPRQ